MLSQTLLPKSTLKDCSKEVKITYDLELAAQQIDFTWSSTDQILENIKSEVIEIKEAMATKPNDVAHIQDEIGDLYMAVINLCYYLNYNPKDILNHANKKFAERLNQLMVIMKDHNLNDLKKLTSDEKLTLWQKAKDLSAGAAGEDRTLGLTLTKGVLYH